MEWLERNETEMAESRESGRVTRFKKVVERTKGRRMEGSTFGCVCAGKSRGNERESLER